MVLMTPDLKKLPGTLQFNTTQLSPFCFWVTRTTGNPVYAYWASSFCWSTKLWLIVAVFKDLRVLPSSVLQLPMKCSEQSRVFSVGKKFFSPNSSQPNLSSVNIICNTVVFYIWSFFPAVGTTRCTAKVGLPHCWHITKKDFPPPPKVRSIVGCVK